MDVSIIAGGGGALQLNVPKVTCVGFKVNSVHMRRTDFEQVLGITRRFQSMIYFLRYFNIHTLTVFSDTSLIANNAGHSSYMPIHTYIR